MSELPTIIYVTRTDLDAEYGQMGEWQEVNKDINGEPVEYVARTTNTALVDALEFYAERGVYTVQPCKPISEIHIDLGQKARTALATYKTGSGGWVSVEDRLPELGAEVLCVKQGKIYIHEFCEIREAPLPWASATISTGEWFADDDDYDVTHWMPLPEPPKVGSGEGVEG